MAPRLFPAPARLSHFFFSLNDFSPPSRSLEQATRSDVCGLPIERFHSRGQSLTPTGWFGTPTWPPWRHVKTLYFHCKMLIDLESRLRANVKFFTFIVCGNVFLNLSLCTNVARRKKWRRVNHWMMFVPHFDAFCTLFFFLFCFFTIIYRFSQGQKRSLRFYTYDKSNQISMCNQMVTSEIRE